MNRLSKVAIRWSPAFAYAVGLITTDGNLSPDGRHINFTSKDKALAESFRDCLGLNNKIGKKSRGGSEEKKYFVVQFGDKNFYEFLLGIGLMPAKSKIIKSVEIPRTFFADFLRGCIDGDGNIEYHKHPESKHLQLRTRIYSASPDFLHWLKSKVSELLGIETGWIKSERNSSVSALNYAKADSLKLLQFVYYKNTCCLQRKYKIAKIFLGRVAESV